MKTDEDIILFLYNIKSGNYEGTITAFENVPCTDDDLLSKKAFFVNYTDFEGGIIVALLFHTLEHK